MAFQLILVNTKKSHCWVSCHSCVREDPVYSAAADFSFLLYSFCFVKDTLPTHWRPHVSICGPHVFPWVPRSCTSLIDISFWVFNGHLVLTCAKWIHTAPPTRFHFLSSPTQRRTPRPIQGSSQTTGRLPFSFSCSTSTQWSSPVTSTFTLHFRYSQCCHHSLNPRSNGYLVALDFL